MIPKRSTRHIFSDKLFIEQFLYEHKPNNLYLVITNHKIISNKIKLKMLPCKIRLEKVMRDLLIHYPLSLLLHSIDSSSKPPPSLPTNATHQNDCNRDHFATSSSSYDDDHCTPSSSIMSTTDPQNGHHHTNSWTDKQVVEVNFNKLLKKYILWSA